MTTFGQVSQTCKSMHMMIIKSTCINIVLLTFSESKPRVKIYHTRMLMNYRRSDGKRIGYGISVTCIDFVSDIFFLKVFIVSQVNLGI